MNDQNPRIHISETVKFLELKPGYWVQCHLKGKYNIASGQHDKYACVEIMVDEETGDFIVRIPKNVRVERWNENNDKGDK